MQEIAVLPGVDKLGEAEPFDALHLLAGQLWAVVGNTGSGKSRLIKDIEQLVDGESVTRRHVLIDGAPVPADLRADASANLIAHLSQSMRFVLDVDVAEFVRAHARVRGTQVDVEEVVNLANRITPEHVCAQMGLAQLSGGQTRALMIADVALVCHSPVVLVDEIENAGIDKRAALQVLTDAQKLVLIVTHDPHTALMAHARIVLEGGAVVRTVERTAEEKGLFDVLDRAYDRSIALQARLRAGEVLA